MKWLSIPGRTLCTRSVERRKEKLELENPLNPNEKENKINNIHTSGLDSLDGIIDSTFDSNSEIEIIELESTFKGGKIIGIKKSWALESNSEFDSDN